MNPKGKGKLSKEQVRKEREVSDRLYPDFPKE